MTAWEWLEELPFAYFSKAIKKINYCRNGTVYVQKLVKSSIHIATFFLSTEMDEF